MFKSIAVLTALTALTACTTLSAEPLSNSAPVTQIKYVDYDGGGRVDLRLLEVVGLVKAGTQVKIRGNCWSACTMYLKLLETDQLCAYPSASFHFHAPYHMIGGEKVLANDAYQQWMLQQYPNKIHMILASMGGLTAEWLHMAGPRWLEELEIPSCTTKGF